MRSWCLVLSVAATLLLPSPLLAADRDPLDVHWWSLAPFVGLLLAIALMPLVAERVWHSNLRKAFVVLAFAAPAVLYLVILEWVTGQPGVAALWHGLEEYGDFIVLLAVLYTVAGGILVEARLPATPVVNTVFLVAGAVLANLIGTTGASMVLIRPMLRINKSRRRVGHVPIFFVFVVSNVGGLLTPLGDPPLFLGFLRGIDFAWTLQLWPQWLLANGLVLLVFFVWDLLAYRAETPVPDEQPAPSGRPLRLHGVVNVFFLAGILLVVLLQSPDIAVPLSRWLQRLVAGADVQVHRPWAALLMVVLGVGSLLATPRQVRHANAFTWHPIVEVAVLFAGIFITMVPALDLLARHGTQLGLSKPWQYFWLTGSLSSFLDNAPTYLTFATIAAENKPIASLVSEAPRILQAISCGAVFFGAMTYIGNGPNFMVKAIAEHSGIKTPSFFGYLAYSILILLPIFALVGYLFFRP